MRITESITIPVPRQDLFSFLRDPDNDPLWCENVRDSRLEIGQRGEEGAVYVQEHKPGPFAPEVLAVTLLRVVPDTRIHLEAVDSFATFAVTYTLADIGHGTTRLTQHDEITLKGIRKILTPIFSLTVRSRLRHQFEALNAMAEHGALSRSA